MTGRFDARIQDIDGKDSANEGCQLKHWITRVYPEFDRGVEADNQTLIKKFSEFWDSINGTPRKPDGPDISWAANPWVMAITFTPHLCNIDQMALAA